MKIEKNRCYLFCCFVIILIIITIIAPIKGGVVHYDKKDVTRTFLRLTMLSVDDWPFATDESSSYIKIDGIIIFSC